MSACTFPKGHIYVAALGQINAGKTSIMKLILQLMPATSAKRCCSESR